MRYAEVVLTYAEALNECGEGARALVELNKERRIELCYEWDRFFDLVRQKRAATVIREYGFLRANKRGYYFREGVNEVFPIPQNEIDISNGVVEQNSGY